MKLYIQADYFLLSRLKDQALKRLKAGFCSDAIGYFRYLVFETDNATYDVVDGSWAESKAQSILEDFHKAVKLAYSVLTARDLHKTVTAFTLCLRGRIDIAILEGLFKDVPEFGADFHNIITALLFDEEFRGQLGSRTLPDKALSCDQVDICCRCLAELGNLDDFFVSPLPDGDDKWCGRCAHFGYADLIGRLIQRMPID